MKQGIVIFAFNNDKIDYVKQAVYCAKRVKKYLGLPVQLITSGIDYIKNEFPFYTDYIDEITYVKEPQDFSVKSFYNGIYSKQTLEWKNNARDDAFALSIFDKTIVIDSDLIISNNKLLECFTSQEDFMIAKDYDLINTHKQQPSFDRVSYHTVPMYWATILYFTKSDTSEHIFNLVKHIKENYNYYRLVYDIAEGKFRNDFAFSIAIHMMRGFTEDNNWPKKIPTDMWVATDKDILVDIHNENIQLLAQREYDYLSVKLTDATVHVMNKFSLNDFVNKEFSND